MNNEELLLKRLLIIMKQNELIIMQNKYLVDHEAYKFDGKKEKNLHTELSNSTEEVLKLTKNI